jgi:hypothetical protein
MVVDVNSKGTVESVIEKFKFELHIIEVVLKRVEEVIFSSELCSNP